MGPPAPRRRWVPKPIDEVAAPIRPSPLPLVGARRPPTKLPALNEKLPDLKPVFGLRRPEEVNDFEEPADLGLGRWLEGGKASALRLHSGLRVLDDLKGSDALKKPKIAFNLLTFLASELLDAGRSRERPRTLLLKRLVLLLETSIFPSKELQRKVMQEASHSVALAEDNIHTQRDTSQVLEDVVKVNQWQLEETIRPRLSPQEMWTRRSGMSSSQGPVIRWTGAEDADLLSLVAASNIQRWHCTQLIEQARWVNEIDSSREAQISAAYNMLGLVQELTGGFAVGWAFAFWRLLWKEEIIEAEQVQKMERSVRINREYVGLFFTSWSHIAVALQTERRKEELNIKKLHKRMLGVRLQEAEDRRHAYEREHVSDKSVNYMMTRKLQAAQEDKSRVDYRLQTMSPADARRALHLIMEIFMNLLGNFSLAENMLCKQKMLSKDILFLATEPNETIQDILCLPCQDILTRWLNCILMETKHRAASLLTAGDVEDSRQNWQANDRAKYSKRCQEVRTFPLVETTSFEEHFQDGKLLTFLYAMLRAFRQKSAFFDPADLAVLDEKDDERRAVLSADYFNSLSPMLITRFMLKSSDIVAGRAASLRSSLCAVFLREAPAIRSFLHAQSLAEDQTLHIIDEKERLRRSRRHVILPTGLPRLENSRELELEIQFPMAKIMHMFQDVAGRVAYADMFDLSRLCLMEETIWSLSRLSLGEVLCRWVNLQVFGSITAERGSQQNGVTNLCSDLASGMVLLRLIKAVASSAIQVEELNEQVEECLANQQLEDKAAMKLAIVLIRRCVPYCFLSDESLLSGQEDALTTAVAGLFLSWLHLRPEPDSNFAQKLEGVDRLLEVGLNVAAMPAEAVPESEDKSDLLDSYCKECFASGEGRLISSLVAIEEQHRAMFLLQTRLRNLIAEVMVRRVISRRRFKSSGSDDAHTMVCLQELVRDQDWIMLTETEHPATRSARPQSVVKEKRLLVAQLFDYLSIRGPRGERQVYWSGIAKLYRDAHLSCPCLFLPKAAAQRIFRQVLDAEPEALEASVTLHAKILHMEVPNLQESEDTSWQDYGLSLYGFVRYLLRIALHREDMAQQTGATAVSLTRSLRELFGSHLQKVQLNAKQDQFTLSARIVEVHQLQLSWEPFLRAVFALYAEQGHICNRPEEELRMGEDSLVNLLSDANLLGATLSRASTRSVYQSMANRRHFTSVSSKFCFRGQAEVRRRGRKGKRARSMPPQLKGAQPYFAELTAVDSLHFEDFQEVCLALAMYRNPNLVVPMELRLEEFLTAMVDGLKHRIFRTAEMPEHLVVEVKSEEADAKQRAWEELLDALEDCGQANVPSEIWRRRRRFMMQHPQEEEADTDNGSTRRSSSAPPSISVPSKLQKALQMARDSSESAVSVLSALKPSEGSLDGLGLPTGSRLESITSVMRAAKRFGAEINVAELKKKRSEIGKEALHRRRKLATIKVRFLADRQIRAAISANAASGIGT